MLPSETNTQDSQQTLESMQFPISYVSFGIPQKPEAEAEAFLANVGLSPSDFTTPNKTISGIQFKAFIDDALAHHDQSIPLSFVIANNFNVGTHGIFGMALVSSSNLVEALNIGLEFYKLIMPAITFSVEEGETESACVVDCHPGFEQGTHLLIEICVLVMASFLQHAKPPIKPNLIQFKHEPKASPELYEKQLGCKVEFNCSRNRLFVDNDCGEAAMSFNDLTTVSSLTAQLRDEQKNRHEDSLRSNTPWTNKTREYLTANINNAENQSKDHVAVHLNLTPRTLARKLQQEGTGYQEVLDNLKSDLAVADLKNTNKPITQIAYELGFNEPQAFARAFKRWTGKSASEYRSDKDASEIGE